MSFALSQMLWIEAIVALERLSSVRSWALTNYIGVTRPLLLTPKMLLLAMIVLFTVFLNTFTSFYPLIRYGATDVITVKTLSDKCQGRATPVKVCILRDNAIENSLQFSLFQIFSSFLLPITIALTSYM